MEVLILDSLYRRVEVVDDFETLIWTERFRAKGDFELHTSPTTKNRSRFTKGTRLALYESYRVMTVDTISEGINADGVRTLIVKGFSLEAVLEQRIAMAALTDLTTDPQWILTGQPKDIATQMFHDICVTGILNAGDIISGVNEINIFPSDTIPEPVDSITYVVNPTTLYEATKTICDAYFMGFRLVRDHDTTQLYYDIYMGCDRTTQQTTFPAVVFSPELQNLHSTNKLESWAPYKNVAYVVSPVGHEVVYLDDVDPSMAGFERRVLLVKADDITDPDGPTASALMVQRGKQELTKNRSFVALDGEVAQTSQYTYGISYNLGDLVTQEDGEGGTAQMQVTEQIFVSDQQGDRSYPTLTIDQIVTVGSWLARDPLEEWFDLDADSQTWADQP
jgi:hypothetical protein